MPIYLYRLNLGWILGHRFLLFVHLGRKSGLLRETVLEVILYDPATRESVVLSAWGKKADWYRNIEAVPALEVRTGGQRYVPEQRFLAPEENHAIISAYGQHHPLAFRVFARVFGYPLDRTEAAPRGRLFLAPGGLPPQKPIVLTLTRSWVRLSRRAHPPATSAGLLPPFILTRG